MKLKSSSVNYKWFILFASFLAFVAFAFSFQLAPPLIPSIVEEFGINHIQAGLLMSIVLLPGIFFSLPAGLVVEKFGIKNVGFLALIFIIFGSFLTVSSTSFLMMLIGRFILGVGGSFIIPTTGAMISQWFSHEELGKAMGIYGINMPFATILAFPIGGFFSNTMNWRFPFFIGLGLGLIAIIVFIILAKGKNIAIKKEKNIREALRNFEIWKVGIIWLFFNAAALSFTTWAPKLFETYRGMSTIEASFLASILMIAAIIFVPIFGWLSDKSGKRKLFTILGSFTMMLSFIAIAFSENLALSSSIIALGITAAMIPPIASTLPAEILGPNLASLGFGITGICMNIGVVVTQPFIGFIIDVTESYSYSIFVMAALSGIGTLISYSLKTK